MWTSRSHAIMHFTIVLFFALVSLTCTGPLMPVISAKPDLVIQKISYQRLPNCFQGYPSGVICLSGQNLEFTVRIANIGGADFQNTLFIENTKSMRGLREGYYGHGQTVNVSKQAIGIGGWIDVVVWDVIEDSVSAVKFYVNTTGRMDKNYPLPPVDELDYTNNTFVVDISN